MGSEIRFQLLNGQISAFHFFKMCVSMLSKDLGLWFSRFSNVFHRFRPYTQNTTY